MNYGKVFKNLCVSGEMVDIACTDGVIVHIGKLDCDGIDLGGKRAYAGLVDIHTHGICGLDTMDGDIEGLAALYAKAGTTSFCPTTMTAPLSDIEALLKLPTPKGGARSIGFHLEGPFINPKYSGAQCKEHMQALPPELAHRENVSLITLAPELDGAMDFIRNSGAKISIGHTSADYDTAYEAFAAGAACVSHIFNAMPPMHHRDPSVVGAAFDKNAYVQVICDGIHIHPAVVRMLYSLFGSERMILISDSMCACGLEDGQYTLGGMDITVKDGIARTVDGALAGSTSTLLDCVKCVVGMGIDVDEAFKMASATPADMLGLNCGRISVGAPCDLIVVDEELSLCATIIGGEII